MSRKHLLAGESVFTLSEFLTPDECRELIESGENRGFEFATVAGADIPTYRNNSRVNFVDAKLATSLWERARPHLPSVDDEREPIGFNDHLKFYRYEAGEHFDCHSDGIVPFEDGTSSAYTFLVYLNEECDGGETAFRVREDGAEVRQFLVEPKTGTALCFDHRILHRGEAVHAGAKYVLRTDVVYSAPPPV